MASTLRIALDQLLPNGGLAEFVRSRRADGTSWRRISVELHQATGVDVAHESLRKWFNDEVEVSA